MSIWRFPDLSFRWMAGVPAQPAGVAQAGRSPAGGNIAEPLMWLVAFGYGMGALVGQVNITTTAGPVTVRISCSWPAARSA